VARLTPWLMALRREARLRRRRSRLVHRQGATRPAPQQFGPAGPWHGSCI